MKSEILVTGGTGFVGSHLVRQLVAQGRSVRVLARKTSPTKALEGVAVEWAYGDLQDPISVGEAVRGCRYVYHVAADYRLWTRDPKQLYASNVEGTKNVLAAVTAHRVERLVYTSTVGALGYSSDGSPATETTPVGIEMMIGHYKRSKYFAEQEALRAVREGCPVVIVNPSTPVGPWDMKPTSTGQIVVDFLNGKIPGYVDTGLNLIDVEDVARGHILAMEKGRIGEKYILGHKNVSLREMLEILARLGGRKAPQLKVPWPMAYAVGAVHSSLSWVTGHPPAVPLDGVRMARKRMYFDAGKAVRELGLPQGSVEEALKKAVDWFRRHEYVAG